jgi:hypothetical protein
MDRKSDVIKNAILDMLVIVENRLYGLPTFASARVKYNDGYVPNNVGVRQHPAMN